MQLHLYCNLDCFRWYWFCYSIFIPAMNIDTLIDLAQLSVTVTIYKIVCVNL